MEYDAIIKELNKSLESDMEEYSTIHAKKKKLG